MTKNKKTALDLAFEVCFVGLTHGADPKLIPSEMLRKKLIALREALHDEMHEQSDRLTLGISPKKP